jgi:serine/threonine-protein kinase
MTESGPIPVREGDLVAGKYRVERVIGRGGMGLVVAARHEQLEQRVAIKFVHGEALANDQGVQRFLREARAAARLKSEHAARVLDVGTLESGVPYMVMELLEGADLSQWLEEHGPLPIEVAAEWIAQACEAIAEAHAAGIVHRDLKPQNLFLARTVGGSMRVKVLDFGVSKSVESAVGGELGSLTRTRSMLGSPLYMAPEQMRSARDVDARADVWALGVVLFELLTRRWPFEADALPALCLKVVSDPPLSLAELRPDIPEAMLQIVQTCLEKEKEKRFANAAVLATALEPFVPPRSRVAIERARRALAASESEAGGPAGSLRPSRQRGASSAKAPARAAPTPAAWDSGRTARRGSSKRTPLWFGGGAVAIATIAVAVLSLRHRPSGGVDSPSPSERMSVPIAGTRTSDAEKLLSERAVSPAALPVVSLAPPPPVDGPVPATSPASATPSPAAVPPRSLPAVAPPVPASANRVAPAVPPGLAHPEAARKPGTSDDDIPSLR